MNRICHLYAEETVDLDNEISLRAAAIKYLVGASVTLQKRVHVC